MNKTPFPNPSNAAPCSDPERDDPDKVQFSSGEAVPGPELTRVTPEVLVLDETRTMMISYFEPSCRVRFVLLRDHTPECMGETVMKRPLKNREELHTLALQLVQELDEHPGEPGELQSW